jgi:hypothetical protein
MQKAIEKRVEKIFALWYNKIIIHKKGGLFYGFSISG